MAAQSTLKTIAEKTGLSVPTISQILNDRKNFCSEATRQRVRDVAREIGYRPNFAYKLMQGQKTKTVAILNSMPQMNSEEYILKLIMLLISGFDKLGYSAYCHAFSNDPAANLEKIRTLINRGVEHFVFLGCPFGHEAILRELERYKLPAIGNSPAFKRRIDKGTWLAGRALFEFFRGQVGENFKLICQKKEAGIGNDRIQALMAMYPEMSLEEIVAKKVFLSDDIDFEVKDYAECAYPVGYDATRRLLEAEPGIGGIVYMNDSFAVGGGSYLLQPGNEQYRHILLAGCNNEHVIRKFPLPISSIAFNLEDMAELMVRNSLMPGPCELVMKSRLHIRTANPAGQYPPWTETIMDLTTEGA